MHNHDLSRNFRTDAGRIGVGLVLASVWERVFTVLLVIG